MCASINFIRNWKSVGGEGNWPNRALVFLFHLYKRILDANCPLQKIQDRKTPYSMSWFARFRISFFDFGDNSLWNGFFGWDLITTFHMLGILLWDGSHWKIYISKLSLLIFGWELGDKVYGAYQVCGCWALLGISRACFQVFSAACPALMASQKSFTKGIVICTTSDRIFNEGVSKIFKFTLSA